MHANKSMDRHADTLHTKRPIHRHKTATQTNRTEARQPQDQKSKALKQTYACGLHCDLRDSQSRRMRPVGEIEIDTFLQSKNMSARPSHFPVKPPIVIVPQVVSYKPTLEPNLQSTRQSIQQLPPTIHATYFIPTTQSPCNVPWKMAVNNPKFCICMSMPPIMHAAIYNHLCRSCGPASSR